MVAAIHVSSSWDMMNTGAPDCPSTTTPAPGKAHYSPDCCLISFLLLSFYAHLLSCLSLAARPTTQHPNSSVWHCGIARVWLWEEDSPSFSAWTAFAALGGRAGWQFSFSHCSSSTGHAPTHAQHPYGQFYSSEHF